MLTEELNTDTELNSLIKYIKIKKSERSESEKEKILLLIDQLDSFNKFKREKIPELDSEHIKKIISENLSIEKHNKEKVIFRYDDHANNFYFILKGKVASLSPCMKRDKISGAKFFDYILNLYLTEETNLLKTTILANYEEISFRSLDRFLRYEKIFFKHQINELINGLEEYFTYDNVLSLFKKYKRNINYLQILDNKELRLIFYLDKKLNDYKNFGRQIFDSKTMFNDFLKDGKEKKLFEIFINNSNQVANLLGEIPKFEIKNLQKFEDIMFKLWNCIKITDPILYDQMTLLDIDPEFFKKEFKEKDLENMEKYFEFGNFIGFIRSVNKIDKSEEKLYERYSYMRNEEDKKQYKLYGYEKINELNNKDYFGDNGLESGLFKRTACMKTEDHTILGVIPGTIYVKHIFEQNKKIKQKNLEFMNSNSLLSPLNCFILEKNYYDDFEVLEYFKDQVIFPQIKFNKKILEEIMLGNNFKEVLTINKPKQKLVEKEIFPKKNQISIQLPKLDQQKFEKKSEKDLYKNINNKNFLSPKRDLKENSNEQRNHRKQNKENDKQQKQKKITKKFKRQRRTKYPNYLLDDDQEINGKAALAEKIEKKKKKEKEDQEKMMNLTQKLIINQNQYKIQSKTEENVEDDDNIPMQKLQDATLFLVKKGHVDIYFHGSLMDLQELLRVLVERLYKFNILDKKEYAKIVRELIIFIEVAKKTKQMSDRLEKKQNYLLFSVNENEFIGIELAFFNLPCLYLVKVKSEKLKGFNITSDNFRKITKIYDEVGLIYEKMAISKVKNLIMRLNTIRISFMEIYEEKENEIKLRQAMELLNKELYDYIAELKLKNKKPNPLKENETFYNDYTNFVDRTNNDIYNPGNIKNEMRFNISEYDENTKKKIPNYVKEFEIKKMTSENFMKSKLERNTQYLLSSRKSYCKDDIKEENEEKSPQSKLDNIGNVEKDTEYVNRKILNESMKFSKFNMQLNPNFSQKSNFMNSSTKNNNFIYDEEIKKTPNEKKRSKQYNSKFSKVSYININENEFMEDIKKENHMISNDFDTKSSFDFDEEIAHHTKKLFFTRNRNIYQSQKIATRSKDENSFDTNIEDKILKSPGRNLTKDFKLSLDFPKINTKTMKNNSQFATPFNKMENNCFEISSIKFKVNKKLNNLNNKDDLFKLSSLNPQRLKVDSSTFFEDSAALYDYNKSPNETIIINKEKNSILPFLDKENSEVKSISQINHNNNENNKKKLNKKKEEKLKSLDFDVDNKLDRFFIKNSNELDQIIKKKNNKNKKSCDIHFSNKENNVEDCINFEKVDLNSKLSSRKFSMDNTAAMLDDLIFNNQKNYMIFKNSKKIKIPDKVKKKTSDIPKKISNNDNNNSNSKGNYNSLNSFFSPKMQSSTINSPYINNFQNEMILSTLEKEKNDDKTSFINSVNLNSGKQNKFNHSIMFVNSSKVRDGFKSKTRFKNKI